MSSEVRREKAHQILKDTNTIMEGHFVGGRSGKHYSTLIRKENLLAKTHDFTEICRLLAAQVSEETDISKIDAVVGPVSGGAIVSACLAYQLSKLHNREIKGAFLDKKNEVNYQMRQEFRAAIGSQNILLVDDVIRSSDELDAAYDELINTGASVQHVAVMIKRNEFKASSVLNTLPVTVMVECLEDGYAPDEVPEWLQKVPIDMTIDQSFNHKKIVIGLTGRYGAGKTTFIQECTKHSSDTMTISTSGVIRDTLDLWGIPATRRNMNRLYGLIQLNHGNDAIVNVVRKRILASPYKYVFIDGVRGPNVMNLLSEFENSILIHVHADDETRFSRVKVRDEKPDEVAMTFDDFMQSDTTGLNKNDPILFENADIKIDNNGSSKELESEVEKFLKQLPK